MKNDILYCDGGAEICKCTCHQTDYPLPKDFPLTQATLQEFREKFVIKNKSSSTGYWWSVENPEATPELVEAFITQKERAAYLAGIRHIAEKVGELIDKHDPQTGHSTSPAYWGNTLRKEFEKVIHQELSQVEKQNNL